MQAEALAVEENLSTLTRALEFDEYLLAAVSNLSRNLFREAEFLAVPYFAGGHFVGRYFERLIFGPSMRQCDRMFFQHLGHFLVGGREIPIGIEIVCVAGVGRLRQNRCRQCACQCAAIEYVSVFTHRIEIYD